MSPWATLSAYTTLKRENPALRLALPLAEKCRRPRASALADAEAIAETFFAPFAVTKGEFWLLLLQKELVWFFEKRTGIKKGIISH